MGFLSSLGKIAGIAAAPFTGGSSLAMTLAGTALDVGSSLYAASRSSGEASANRDFQAQMSNTSYQRAVQDMRAAGLNPILAYSQGGASTPTGAVGDMSALNQRHGSNSIANATSLAQIRNIDQNTKTSAADMALKLAQAKNTSANTALTMTELPRGDARAWWNSGLTGKASAALEGVGGSLGAAVFGGAVGSGLKALRSANPIGFIK